MSLTYQERYLLEELRQYLKRVEKMAPAYPFDLDDFAIEYMEVGFPIIGDEVDLINERAAARKVLFENGQKEKVEIYLPEE